LKLLHFKRKRETWRFNTRQNLLLAARFYTCSKIHPASYWKCAEVSNQGVKLFTFLHLVHRFKMRGAITPHPIRFYSAVC